MGLEILEVEVRSGTRDIRGEVGVLNTWASSSPWIYNKNITIVDLHELPISGLTWTRCGSLVSLKSKLRHNEINATGTERRKARKHLDISDWLKVLELEQYADCFAGYDGVEELLEFTESDVKDLGVKIASHRARIMSSLTALSAKYNNNKRPIQRDAVSRHSLAADSGRRIQQCDAL
ncbi:uncharacterized protein LOC116172475 [Photinus pyralis]|uniref:uncharacterized protein LOC116172475 n=1 Tax=Photinus pyralis TaxID=7054 RepID=UPI001266F152|nr:uncharacterized protein LOC116172475 [Photinus pyralis]